MRLSILVSLNENENRLRFVTQRYREKVAAIFSDGDEGYQRNTKEFYLNNADRVIHNFYLGDATQKKTYVEWLIKQYLLDRRTAEDLPAINTDLQTFEQIKARLPVEQRDINKMNRRQLQDLVEPYQRDEMEKSKRQQDKELEAKIKKDVIVVYDGPEGSVKIPKTQEASCYLGRGTRWCTAAKKDNMFSYYSEQGHLYVFTFKDGTKWQMHFAGEDTQLMDEQDRSVDPKKLIHSSLFKASRHKIEATIDDGWAAAAYAMDIIGERSIKAEHMMFSHPDFAQYYNFLAVYYEKLIKGPWPEFEHALARSVRDKHFKEVGFAIMAYAMYDLKKRWIEGEKLLELIPHQEVFGQNGHGYQVFDYIKDLVKGRVEFVEKAFRNFAETLKSGAVMDSYYKKATIDAAHQYAREYLKKDLHLASEIDGDVIAFTRH